MTHSTRRTFLKATVTATAAATLMASGVSSALSASSPTPSTAADQVAYFGINVTNNLHENGAYAQIESGQISDTLNLSGNEAYRVRVSTTDRPSVFGPMYHVELFQADGTPLDSMFAGLTATFRRYGVQVLVMPVTQSQAAARAVSQR